jgi:uncharacterized protein YndB with AHSA1/START domain
MAQATDTLAPNVLELTRIFDAPRELLWLAWSRPDMRVAWLGPVEWPAVSCENDLRVGGAWRTCLRSATSDDALWQGGVYREVIEPERMVFTFKWDSSDHEDGPPVDTLVTIDFTALPDGRTRMDFRHEGLKSEESLAGHRHGWTSTFDRLDQWIEQERKP